ncbi:hypothetical protein ABEB36_014384 [Hypothenemus hampei]|uniref:Uncharacterized protein n=1 Tax=Hypothenemus hampei TaxID=57062 RepID=A0ABD1E4L1_HYPHA
MSEKAVLAQAATDRQPTTVVKTASAADPRSAEDGKASGMIQKKRKKKGKASEEIPGEVERTQEPSCKKVAQSEHSNSPNRSGDTDSDQETLSGKFWKRIARKKGTQTDSTEKGEETDCDNRSAEEADVTNEYKKRGREESESPEKKKHLKRQKNKKEKTPLIEKKKSGNYGSEKDPNLITLLDVMQSQAAELERLLREAYRPKKELEDAVFSLTSSVRETKVTATRKRTTSGPIHTKETETQTGISVADIEEISMAKNKAVSENVKLQEEIAILATKVKDSERECRKLEEENNELRKRAKSLEGSKEVEGIEASRRATTRLIEQILNKQKKEKGDLEAIIDINWAPECFKTTTYQEIKETKPTTIYVIDSKVKDKAVMEKLCREHQALNRTRGVLEKGMEKLITLETTNRIKTNKTGGEVITERTYIINSEHESTTNTADYGEIK